jgi:hypothetical protein
VALFIFIRYRWQRYDKFINPTNKMREKYHIMSVMVDAIGKTPGPTEKKKGGTRMGCLSGVYPCFSWCMKSSENLKLAPFYFTLATSSAG